MNVAIASAGDLHDTALGTYDTKQTNRVSAFIALVWHDDRMVEQVSRDPRIGMRAKVAKQLTPALKKSPSILEKDEKLPWYHLYSEGHRLSALVIR